MLIQVLQTFFNSIILDLVSYSVLWCDILDKKREVLNLEL